MKRLAVLALSSCASFEDPALVLDLRVIAITATPPEQVLDLEVEGTPQLADLEAQLEPTALCVTVADPARAAKLRWSMTACIPENGRCDPERSSFEIASGEALDPEVDPSPICASILPSFPLVALLADVFNADPLRGFAGLAYSVQFRVGAVGAPPEQDQFALKQVHVFARLPSERVANQNPTLLQLEVFSPDQTIPPLGHCAAERPGLSVSPGTKLQLFPIEAETTRENYPVPTTDGSFQRFDETIRYQYLTTGGSFSEGFTGGPPDLVGNEPGLGTTWTAPAGPTDVQIWTVQRDERGGSSVYPLCIRVAP